MSGALAFLGSVGHVLDYAQQEQQRQQQLQLEKMKMQQAAAQFQFTQQQLQADQMIGKTKLLQNLAKTKQAAQGDVQPPDPYSAQPHPSLGQQGGGQMQPQGRPGAAAGSPGNALMGGLPGSGGLAPEGGQQSMQGQMQAPAGQNGPPPAPSWQQSRDSFVKSIEQQVGTPVANMPPAMQQRVLQAAQENFKQEREDWQDNLKVYQAQQLQARTAATEKRQEQHENFIEGIDVTRLGLDRARLGIEESRLGMEAQRLKDAEGKTLQASPDAIYDSAREYRETGKMPALGLNAGTTRTQIINEAARQRRLEKVTVEADIAHSAGVTADSRSLNNLQKQADAAESFEATARKNFALALSLAPKGVPTNLGPFVNRWVQGGSTALGGKDVPPYVAALLTGADEYAKIMSGSTGSQGSTVDARRAAADMFSSAYNVDQIKSVIEGVAYRDMDNRTQSYDDRLDTIKQRIASNPSTPAQSNAPQKISSDTEYNALPSGAEFIAPDGSHRKKP